MKGILAIITLSILVVSCSQNKKSVTDKQETTAKTQVEATAKTVPTKAATKSSVTNKKGAKMEATNNITIKTNKGAITLELYSKEAPKTVENFKAYVQDGFYSDTIFHRVIDNFMIQGGGFTKSMDQKDTKAPVVNESFNGKSNDKGTIAMARTADPNSATAQFFINLKDNDFLNGQKQTNQWGYTVFGKVTAGLDVVEKIGKVSTGSNGPYQDVPTDSVVIESVTFN